MFALLYISSIDLKSTQAAMSSYSYLFTTLITRRSVHLSSPRPKMQYFTHSFVGSSMKNNTTCRNKRWSSSSSSAAAFSSSSSSSSSSLSSSSSSSSTATTPKDNNNSSKNDKNRIPRTLYRQLIRWCQVTDSNIPLGSFVPPIHIRSPEQIDSRRMELLANTATGDATITKQQGVSDNDDDTMIKRALSLLPHNTEYKSNSMTVPIHSSQTLSKFFQTIFRLNSIPKEQGSGSGSSVPATTIKEEYQKQRISVAFEALKSLNELSNSTISRLRSRREAHNNINRDDDERRVKFRVGQVVQHQQERWRGVVTSWDYLGGSSTSIGNLSEEFGKKTSLTTKDYSTGQFQDGGVRYDIILDEGDIHMMGSDSEWISISDSDLVEPVTDIPLMRIRNHLLSEYFDRFDRANGTFVPNELKSYKYPGDTTSAASNDLSEDERKLCDEVVIAIQQFAHQLLEHLIIVEDSAPDQQQGLLTNVRTRLFGLIDGDILPMRYKLSGNDISPTVIVAHYVRSLLNLSVEILDVMFHRRNSIENKHLIQYKLGDIVQHKVFNFRGVVVACDPTPTVDVTRWDGLQHIENPMQIPFYHVIPDQNDCLESFGGPRPMRYVCEENLELCPDEDRRYSIEVDLDPEWQRSPSGDSYLPPDELRFKYGDTLDDHGVTEHCMTQLQNAINAWQLEARLMKSTKDDPVMSKLSMATMHELVKVVDSVGDAIAIEEMIKEIRKAHKSQDLRFHLDTGVAALLSGKGEEALQTYQTVVDSDPDFPEGHNKMATCLFMLGRIEESLMHTKKVLQLDPTHFQALNGLGLIYFEQGEYEKAIDCFRESINIVPWSPVSSKLCRSMDLVNKSDDRHTTL